MTAGLPVSENYQLQRSLPFPTITGKKTALIYSSCDDSRVTGHRGLPVTENCW